MRPAEHHSAQSRENDDDRRLTTAHREPGPLLGRGLRCRPLPGRRPCGEERHPPGGGSRAREECGRLVPTGFVDSSTETVILRCTLEEFDRLPAAEETEFLPEPIGLTSAQALRWPYYTLGLGGPTSPAGYDGETGYDTVTYDKIPLGEVGIRRGDAVHATDGEIGHVQGLVIDPGTHGVTHVLLREGHLWGRRDVTIPIGSVTDLTFGVHVGLTRDQIGDLPDLRVDRDQETPVTPV